MPKPPVIATQQFCRSADDSMISSGKRFAHVVATEGLDVQRGP